MRFHIAPKLWNVLLMALAFGLTATAFGDDPTEYEDVCFLGMEDCFTGTEEPGCNDPACCKNICSFLPSCCSVEWDDTCASLALDLCEPLPPCPGLGSCFEENDSTGCDDTACCERVCAADGFCCGLFWDSFCVARANELCGLPLCTLPPPSDEIPEPEECADRTNDGCNLAEESFTPIECGDTYRGTAFAGTPRDTDWYQIDLQQEGHFTWRVTPEFPAALMILTVGPHGCDHALEVVATSYGDSCEPTEITFCAEPGEYFFFVSPGTPTGPVRGGVTCPDKKAKDPPTTIFGIEYIAELICDNCPSGVPGDLNGDGSVNVTDLLLLLGQWGQCADANNCPADLNGDGMVNVTDLLLLLGNWG